MNSEMVYLKPGEWFFGSRPLVVETILGSCVGIVVYGGGYAAVAHCILPHQRGPALPEDTGRYVDSALAAILDRFARKNVAPAGLEAKLFGGACVLCYVTGGKATPVGRHNIEAATDILEHAGVPVSACEVGGERGRKILVHTGSGRVTVHTLRHMTHRHSPLVTL